MWTSNCDWAQYSLCIYKKAYTLSIWSKQLIIYQSCITNWSCVKWRIYKGLIGLNSYHWFLFTGEYSQWSGNVIGREGNLDESYAWYNGQSLWEFQQISYKTMWSRKLCRCSRTITKWCKIQIHSLVSWHETLTQCCFNLGCLIDKLVRYNSLRYKYTLIWSYTRLRKVRLLFTFILPPKLTHT